MARVSRDKTSWHASGVLRRDERHTKAITDANQDKSVSDTANIRRKKNTRMWCKGKNGMLHKPVWQKNSHYSHGECDVMEVACETCGKKFEIDFGLFGRPKLGKEVLLEKWKKKLGYD